MPNKEASTSTHAVMFLTAFTALRGECAAALPTTGTGGCLHKLDLIDPSTLSIYYYSTIPQHSTKLGFFDGCCLLQRSDTQREDENPRPATPPTSRSAVLPTARKHQSDVSPRVSIELNLRIVKHVDGRRDTVVLHDR